MEEPRMEKTKKSPKRVFINSLDSYSSRNIAKLLCEHVAGTPAEPEEELKAEEEEEEDEEEEEEEAAESGTLQVVGSVSEKCDEERPFVLEEYENLDREELLLKLRDCDVVIYNISQHSDQLEEALWAVTALHNEMGIFSGPKMFILISTVMTWACSKPVDPDLELPFTDDIFWRRRAHPNFKQHLDLEKEVVKMGKTVSDRTLFSTYVLASGLQYGMGEQVFHFFFKTSWLGHEHAIPVYGDGNNIVPTIHINDLASVIKNVIELQPKPYYLLAVDSSNNTMEDIVKTVASVLGPGKIRKRPFEEAALTQDFSMMEIDSMLVDLRMEAVYLKELFSISWVCDSGLVDNMEQVVEEYRLTRGLLPVRLCVLGPPAVGKSTVSRRICERYKLHHITLKETLSETIAQLEDAVMNSDVDGENEDSVAEAQELLDSLKESMEPGGGVLDDQLLVKMVKDKLTSNPCRNQGFVLDDLPSTYEQAKQLFSGEVPTSSFYCMSVTASDTFLNDRVMNLPEALVQELSYDPELFLRRLATYREDSTEDETVLNFFDELDINSLCLGIQHSGEADGRLLIQRICDTLGKPRNYGQSIPEVKEEERRKAEEKMSRESQERAEEEQRQAEEARHTAAHWEEWRQEAVRQQEEQLLEAKSVPMRSYLTEHVMPTLTQGLIECCRARPADPVDFLAEFLFKNNPFDY
uniref:Adenylate kinase 7b n=1 Tax=Scophthalmus maximus TaxID=52904 RepID=A0A8D3D2P4_SCOMX